MSGWKRSTLGLHSPFPTPWGPCCLCAGPAAIQRALLSQVRCSEEGCEAGSSREIPHHSGAASQLWSSAGAHVQLPPGMLLAMDMTPSFTSDLPHCHSLPCKPGLPTDPCCCPWTCFAFLFGRRESMPLSARLLPGQPWCHVLLLARLPLPGSLPLLLPDRSTVLACPPAVTSGFVFDKRPICFQNGKSRFFFFF